MSLPRSTYRTADKRHANVVPRTLAASAARTTSDSGTAIETADRGVARVLLEVTAASGTKPTLSVLVETSYDNATWRKVGCFTAQTTTGSQRRSFSGLDRFVRARWAIGGTTPSFTFSVVAETT